MVVVGLIFKIKKENTMNIEHLLIERFQARLDLVKVTSEQQRAKVLAKIADLDAQIAKIRPSPNP
jgi:hypothetical protein